MRTTIDFHLLKDTFPLVYNTVLSLGEGLDSCEISISNLLNIKEIDLVSFEAICHPHLATHYGNLLIVGAAFSLYSQDHKALIQEIDADAKWNKALLEHLLYLENAGRADIEYVGMTTGITSSNRIKHPEINALIIKTLYSAIIQDHRSYIKTPGLTIDMIDSDLIHKKLNEIKYLTLKESRGRKKIHEDLQRFVMELQSFLQAHTILKAKEGVNISDDQCRFITSYLEIFGFVSDVTDEVDYVRSMLSVTRGRS